MVRRSDKSKLIDEYNHKRNLISSVLRDILMSVQGRKIKPYNFGVAKDGGFCVFVRGDGMEKNNLERVQDVVKKENFIVYIATEGRCYIIKPNEIKEYEGHQAEKFRELISEEISTFHMRLVTN